MITASTTLREVFENHYRPERLPRPEYDTLKKWRQTLNWWSRELGRHAVVTDVTPENIERIAQQLATRGIGENSLKSFRMHTMTVWWYLEDKGIVTNAPKRRPKGRPRIRPIAPPRTKLPTTPTDWTVIKRPRPVKK
ncbi:MAG TPA: hypothetical protein VGM05_33155, partial [Planctomycetaceae bacterium]